MAMGKRIVFFLLTNVAVIAVLSIVMSVFNIAPYLEAGGINYTSLLIFAGLFGFGGAFISLFISKWMAKKAFGIHLIEEPSDENERFVKSCVEELAKKVDIDMPEVGIYTSPEPNAFATGRNKNKALVAVSTGLMENLTSDEVESVLGHEISHISNGDMVTLTLIQGVVNTFVIFFARIVAHVVGSFMSDEEEGGGMSSMAYFATSIVFEILFGILASMIVMAFSRYREFRADSGSARLLGKEGMIHALEKLGSVHITAKDSRGKAFSAMKINDKSSFLQLFSSHPSIERRIEALKKH
jgi:heat shock protein HtpX